MKKLKRKIKALEASMNKDARSMRASRLVAARYIHSLRFILISSTLSFALGVALGYKNNFAKAARVAGRLGVKLYKLRNRAAVFLSFFP